MFSSRKTGSASNNYLLTKSLRFRSSASAYLNRTPASAGNRQTWTWSAWIKRGVFQYEGMFSCYTGSGSVDNSYLEISFNADKLQVSGYTTVYRQTSQVFRDPSAWYHIVVAVDTTQATGSNRVKVYANGAQVTAFALSNDPAQNANLGINQAALHNICNNAYFSNYYDGEMAEVNFVDGQQLSATSFGSTNALTGVWQPAKYTGTYGTNGFYLPFTDTTSTTTLGNDSSGNGNNWTTNNISLTAGITYDSMTDVPTNTNSNTANYCVLNPLDKYASLPISNGNLTLNGGGSGGNWWSTRSTIWVSSGKWYWESTIGGSQYNVVGVAGVNQPISTNDRWVGYTSDSYGYYGANGNKINNNTSSAYGASYTAGDVIGVALDMDAGTIEFYKNNSSQGTAFTGISGSVTPAFSVNDQGTDPYQDANFGQRPFSYTPPSGYVALNTFNLPTPTIGASSASQANKYFDVTTYTGTGSSQSITNSGSMQPDFVWIKGRSGATDHGLYDAVRGVQIQLESNNTNAETTETTGLTAFNSNGFTVGALAQLNTSSATYVGWQWKANGSGSTNTAGSITSTVSANTTAGFSIVNYVGNNTSGATVGHGLGVAPSMIIVKNRDQATAGGDSQSWFVYHRSIGATGQVTLNTTGAVVTNAEYWNNTAPSATVFSLGNGNRTNFTGDDYIAYCWAEISGFSRFGSYTGNFSSDGPFVFTGFRPKFIMFKNSSAAENWFLMDATRSPNNIVSLELYPNLSNAEGTDPKFDMLSNGFKIRAATATINGSGNTIIYAAFAESPFKYANAR